MSTPANVSGVRVDDEGVTARADKEVVLDVLFDGRRIWSFWLQRDGQLRGTAHMVAWPSPLRRFLNGTTRLSLVEHVGQRVVFERDVRLGTGEGSIEVVNSRGLPLGIDKSNRLAQTFDTRSAEHVKPLLDSIEEVLGGLRKAGIEPFVAYGTLLGAVREGRLIGHDSDADLGYVSRHIHPVDVILESFALQRSLAEMGYRITRYSGAAFKVDVREADGSVRGLDVFGGFLRDGYLFLMGEIRIPFESEWVFPLGTASLEGREVPVPANTDKFLTATYGPSWRVPDPAYKFGTPESTHRRLNGWFRGTRVKREVWDRTYSRMSGASVPDRERSAFASWVLRAEDRVPDHVIDIGCGRGRDALTFAELGSRVLGVDYVPRAYAAAASYARDHGLAAQFRMMNLCELRSTLAESARVGLEPGRRVVLARNIADATNVVGRAHLWRACAMMLAGDGRLYLEFVTRRGSDGFVADNHLRALPMRQVVDEVAAAGGTVVARHVRSVQGTVAERPRRIGRLVVEWQR
ncbi:MAG: methyltransferase domain-containing protein [Nocardioidaceae bacterium]